MQPNADLVSITFLAIALVLVLAALAGPCIRLVQAIAGLFVRVIVVTLVFFLFVDLLGILRPGL